MLAKAGGGGPCNARTDRYPNEVWNRLYDLLDPSQISQMNYTQGCLVLNASRVEGSNNR